MNEKKSQDIEEINDNDSFQIKSLASKSMIDNKSFINNDSITSNKLLLQSDELDFENEKMVQDKIKKYREINQYSLIGNNSVKGKDILLNDNSLSLQINQKS